MFSIITGFQRDCVPLAESRGRLNKPVPSVSFADISPFYGESPLVAVHSFYRTAKYYEGASQRVNLKTVRWTVFKEGDSLLCREMSAKLTEGAGPD